MTFSLYPNITKEMEEIVFYKTYQALATSTMTRFLTEQILDTLLINDGLYNYV